MHTPRVIRSIAVLMLSAWLGGISNAHAAHDIAGYVAVDRPLTDTPAERAGTVEPIAQTNVRASARGSAPGSGGRILFILASSKVHGTSTLPASISFGEVVNAWDTFHAAGYSVDFASPDGGAVPILDRYVSEDMEARLQDDRIMNGLRNTATPAQVDPSRYRAVYYVGGSNAIYGVPEHPVLQNIAMHVYERNGGVISAVCHGTAGIVNLKLANGQNLVAGKRITGFPEEHEEQDAAYFKEFPFLIRKTVESRGGSFHVLAGDQPNTQVDGRVVTGQNYASATQVAEAVVDILRKLAEPGRDAANG
ncbi:type 1 glutamine amidotransferase domain-containing protein [Montanilutibacter psychrotolerans]|uniref:Type 1 glutamine amidotransferase domain-containing protein n=1 Tax=Montanilutibacter psychrotolerans TaxID=1327343 RepID=A0A3M8T4U3_9GAMM|nr:type 1 glutamine amidotransferase domain-containing protein [Lysobacter psychrotolerans]RNF86220.1 type 1 glutamine amidotransferase domain-containing protein [Lysobacter psychrotolerans]